ncbi:MAG: CpaD family pilus assembly protein [Pseudomonadota bacterium]
MRNRLIFLLAAGVAATACTPRFNTSADTIEVERLHPIGVDKTIYDLVIAPGPAEFDLTLNDAARVDALVNAYRARGTGPITITAPQGSANARAATRIVADVRDRMHGAGLPWSVVRGASYRADAASDAAPIYISFASYVATASECGAWSRDESLSYSNLNPANFGCASQSNLAAMVENPGDLITPRGVEPGDTGRRNTVLTGYREGEVTSTTRDPQTITGTNDVFGE